MAKWIGIALVAILGVAACGLAYLALRSPASVPAANVRVEATPARLARGKYLFEAVAGCGDCHSHVEATVAGLRAIEGGVGRGSIMPFDGLPGRVVAPNITPDKETGIGNWTDGEKIRAIRDGVSRDGHALFPMMPYESFAKMSDEDVQSLVVYLNALPPVRNPLPRTELKFPVNLLVKSSPKPAGRVPAVSPQDRLAYGEYLVTLGGCRDCHTPFDKGEYDKSNMLAGGRAFPTPLGTVVSANITSDPETGIGKWNESYFVERFRLYRSTAAQQPLVQSPEQFTMMPWLGLSQMTDEDLAAIYQYLRKQPAINHQINRHPKQIAQQ